MSLKKLNPDVLKSLESVGKVMTAENGIDALIDEALEFYNERHADKDVFRKDGNVIILFKTQKAITKDGEIINAPKTIKSKFGEDTKLVLGNFKYLGKTSFFSAFVPLSLKDLFDWEKVYFLKATKLKITYKLNEDSEDKKIKPKEKKAFIKYVNTAWKLSGEERVNKIEDIDESEYRTFYGANPFQVIPYNR